MVRDSGARAAEDPDSLRHRAFARLRDMIEDGRLRSGDRLTESQVARAFGISRSPAREALALLASQGLIVQRQGRGYEIPGGSGDVHGRAAELDGEKISSSPQWQRIYAEVEQEILNRVLLGSVRIKDRQLADHFGVSRTVTRDLLGRMHGLGIVSKTDTGKWVARQVRPEQISDLFELRAVLEPEALLRAASALDPALLSEALRHVERLLGGAPAGSSDFDRAETDLHITILGACPNPELLRPLRKAHLLFAPTRHLVDPVLGLPSELIDAALREHAEILHALAQGRAEMAAKLLRNHIQVAEARWMHRFNLAELGSLPQLPRYLTFVD
nr:GntR family transcriptional regulator [Enterovirga sp. DB1703]